MTIKKRRTAIGLMSGTSMDGVDAALVDTDGTDVFSLGAFVSIPYCPEFRDRLRAIMGSAPSGDYSKLERDLTLYHAEAVRLLMLKASIEAYDVDVIGFHGQTIFHDPKNALTCQIGDASLLASETSIEVVSNFRAADVAAGGEGAPLAPIFHVAMARNFERPILILNMGGVANITWIGEGGAFIAFDAGPANALIDDWIQAHTDQSYDEGGQFARQGNINVAALEALLAHQYFELPPPKSLDRNTFSITPIKGLSLEDGSATLVAFTAGAIMKAQKHLPAPPNRWLASGGGRHNPELMAAIQQNLSVPVEPIEVVGWDGDALEAQAFAYLAVRSLAGLPLSYPQTTGAPYPVVGGDFYSPIVK